MHVKNTKPHIPKSDINPILNDLKDALEKGNLTFGTEEFENEFANYIGTKYAVAVNSGTSALEAPLRYLNVKDKEVIVPTNTFVASANAVVFAGGIPVMVDMDINNLCADFEDIKRKVNKNTKGIIIVHSCGYIPPYILELKKYCKDRGFKVTIVKDFEQLQKGDIAIVLIRGKSDLRDWHWICYPEYTKDQISEFFGNNTIVKAAYVLEK